MIIVKLFGGLGNQMFQYAIGRTLAYKNKTVLKIDLSGYKNQKNITPRQYELFLYNIEENFLTKHDETIIKKWKINWILSKILNKLNIKFSNHNYIIEKNFVFDQTVLNLKKNVYLNGYWQTEKYFYEISNIIRSEFTLKNNFNHLNTKFLGEINKYNSVSLHVRRGDYVSGQAANEFHGICSLEYYRKAIDIMSEKISNPVFFIFSDDLKWCEENLKINFPVIFIQGNRDYEDLILMSKCKYNIIANSSFSWWGGLAE